MPINGKVQCIDWCIHQIVAALTAGGVETVASCCGHGQQRGRIDLKDGRILWIDGGARRCPPATGLVVSASPADSTVVAPPHLSIPDRDKLRMIRDVPLQEGDWAVECTNPGHFLKVHPDQFGKPASGPAYSFFRENASVMARPDDGPNT